MKHLFLVMQQTQEKRFRCSFQNGTGDVLAESNCYADQNACTQAADQILCQLRLRTADGGYPTPYRCAGYYYCVLKDPEGRILLRTRTRDTKEESIAVWEELVACYRGRIHRFDHTKEKTRLTLPFDPKVMSYMYSLDGQGQQNILNFTNDTQWEDSDSWLWGTPEKEKLYYHLFQPMIRRDSASYIVRVRTGDGPYADTAAKVYITLYSDQKESREFLLEEQEKLIDEKTLKALSKRRAKNIARPTLPGRRPVAAGKVPTRPTELRRWAGNGTELFRLNVEKDLGELKRIRIRHDNTGEEPEWYLKDVLIQKEGTSRRWLFPCERWLYVQRDEKKNSIDLYATAVPAREDEYVLHIVTGGDHVSSGTDANVFVTLYGAEGTSQEYAMPAELGRFDKGSTDSVPITVHTKLGELQRLRIRHDSSGPCPGWYLKQIRVENKTEGKQWRFPCERWLDQTKADKATDWTLVADSKTDGEHVYAVRVKTGIQAGSGTAANVFLTIHGADGSTGEIKLDNRGNDFKPGALDTYRVTTTAALGDLTQVRIRHDAAGLLDGWYLDSVSIERISDHRTWEFPCDRWLDKGKDDGKIDRTLWAVAPGQQEAVYRVQIRTGDMLRAGTNARVFLTLQGSRGDSPEYYLNDPGNDFRQGKTDTFLLRHAWELGELHTLRVRHDNSGLLPEWYLCDIRVELEGSGKSWYFPCERWLDKKKGDGLIELSLGAAAEQGGAQA